MSLIFLNNILISLNKWFSFSIKILINLNSFNLIINIIWYWFILIFFNKSSSIISINFLYKAIFNGLPKLISVPELINNSAILILFFSKAISNAVFWFRLSLIIPCDNINWTISNNPISHEWYKGWSDIS